MPYTTNKRPSVSGQPSGKVETECGGTGTDAVTNWIGENLVVTESMFDTNGGPVKANSRGKLDPSLLGITFPVPTIAGKKTVPPNSSNSWLITNFSSFNTYNISVTGAVNFSITNDVISITAGANGPINLRVNGRDHFITVQ